MGTKEFLMSEEKGHKKYRRLIHSLLFFLYIV